MLNSVYTYIHIYVYKYIWFVQALAATSHSCTATCLPSRKLHKLDEPDTQGTAGEAKTYSSVMYSYGPPHMAKQKQDDQLEHTYSSYVRIRDVALKTCQKRWMIGRSGERGSGISVLAARHDDYDDDDIWFANADFVDNILKWARAYLFPQSSVVSSIAM